MNRVVGKLFRTSLVGQVSKRTKAYTKQDLKQSMNDLPQPCGSWKTNHDALQRSYNGQFLIGIGFMIVTVLFGYVNNLFYLNAITPERPVDKNDYSR